ncbi:MAG: OmpA family protein [Proteobacteria bacterium]|nr:OmpA family protein [Pseudomonadota bacterium]MBI3499886.1 OmpA family protein [Pseudomonadota bacterium]
MDNQPIIIKRIKKGGHGGHHGGAWKVAYADFVTAMMAFFLLLWLLNATTEEQKMGISNYFDPTAISRSARSGSGGVLGGTTITTPGALRNSTSPPAISTPLVARPANDPSDMKDPEGSDPTRGTGNAKAGERGADTKQSPEQGRPNLPGGPGLAAQQAAQGVQQGAQAQMSKEEMDKMLAQREEQRLEQAMKEVRQAIQAKIDLKEVAENVRLEITPEGLRIQLIDQDKETMFPLGSSQLLDHTKKLLDQVAGIVGTLPNKITITGHTDSTPFRNPTSGYGNWELSTDRANASRRQLVASGIREDRVALVVGKADREPLFADNPAAPQNRRISIVVLRETPQAPVGRSAQAGPNPGQKQ